MKTTDFINSYTEDAEYDDEAGMFKNNLHTIIRVSTHLERAIGDNENLPEWCQEKIAQVKGMIVSVMDYMISQHEMGKQEEIPGFNPADAEAQMSEMLGSEPKQKKPAAQPTKRQQEKQQRQQQYRDAFKGFFGGDAADLTKNLKIREDATGGASCSSSVSAVVKELGEEGMTRKQVNKKLGGYTNIATKPKLVKVKGAY
jgi:hypothetical protein